MDNNIVFICTNDMHCAVAGGEGYLGLDGVMGLKRSLEAENGVGNVCLIDSGDALGVGVAGCVSDGEVPLQLMSVCGYSAYCPGNADIAFGARRLVELSQSSKFPFVCCNMCDTASGEELFAPFVLRDIGSVRVGFVGVTTPLCHAGTEAADFADPRNAIELDCCQDDESRLIAAVQSAVDAARANGAQIVVLLAHLGQAGEPAAWRSDTLVAQTHGVDLVADGHSHETFAQRVADAQGRLVPVVQGGLEFSCASVVVLSPDGTLVSMKSVAAGEVELDDNMSRKIDAALEPYCALLRERVCDLPVALIARDADGSWLVRRAETNLGDLVADAVCTAFKADLALVPSWVLRDGAQIGELTVEDVYRIHPLGHRLACARVSGESILAALDLAVSRYPCAYRYWLQVSSSVQAVFDEKSHRVLEARIDGEAVDPAACYVLAGLDFMVLGGGSGFAMFSGAEEISEDRISFVEAVEMWLRAMSADEVAEHYGNPAGSGRIIVV